MAERRLSGTVDLLGAYGRTGSTRVTDPQAIAAALKIPIIYLSGGRAAATFQRIFGPGPMDAAMTACGETDEGDWGTTVGAATL